MPGEERLELPRLEAARLLMAWPLPGAADQMSVVGGDLLTTLLAEGMQQQLLLLLAGLVVRRFSGEDLVMTRMET